MAHHNREPLLADLAANVVWDTAPLIAHVGALFFFHTASRRVDPKAGRLVHRMVRADPLAGKGSREALTTLMHCLCYALRHLLAHLCCLRALALAGCEPNLVPRFVCCFVRRGIAFLHLQTE